MAVRRFVPLAAVLVVLVGLLSSFLSDTVTVVGAVGTPMGESTAPSGTAASSGKGEEETERPTEKKSTGRGGMDELTEGDKAANLPDFTDSEVMDQLRCSACRTVVTEMEKRIDAVKRDHKRNPKGVKSYHLWDAVDNMCGIEFLHYGLLRDRNTQKVEPMYVDEDSKQWKLVPTAKGGWISQEWQKVCEKFMERAEDHLMELYAAKDSRMLMNFCVECEKFSLEAFRAKEEEKERKKQEAEERKRKKQKQKAAKKKEKSKSSAQQDDEL